MLQIDKLQETSSEKYPFHFSAYFTHGLYIFGRDAGQFIGYTLIHLLFFLLVRTLSKEAALGFLIFLPFFLSGYYVAARDIDRDEEIPFGRFFIGYYHAPSLLVIGGIIMIICGVLALPFFLIDPLEYLFRLRHLQFLTSLYDLFGVYPLLLPSILCYSFLRWAPMLFLFSRMSILEALVWSCKLVARRWFLHFVFTLVLVIVGLHFSTYFFFILSLFLLGAVTCADYASFAQITNLNQDESEVELQQSEVLASANAPGISELAPKQFKQTIPTPDNHQVEDHWHVPDERELDEKFERLLRQKDQFEFKNYLPKAFRLFSSDIGNFLPYTFLLILVLLLTRIAGMVGIVVSMLLINQLIAGYFVAGAALQRGQKTNMATYFAAFEFNLSIIFFSFVQLLVNVLLFVPFLLVVGFNMFRLDLFGSSVFPYWSLLLLLPSIYLSTTWRWAPALMVFYHMNLWPAMETSRKLVTRNLFVHVIHVLVISIPLLTPFILSTLTEDLVLRLLGALSLLLLGYSFGADYCAFADVVNLLEDREEEMDLMDHLIEEKE